jgi:predicted DNA-binding transcriptional regulator YafY
MNTKRPLRLIQIITEIKANPRQSPDHLFHGLGVSKAQFYKDRQALEQIGFKFQYCRKTLQFKVTSDPLIPTDHFTFSELFALVMAVRQLSAAGDYVLTFEAFKALQKIIGNSPLEVREILRSSIDDLVLRKGFGCNPAILEELHKAAVEGRHLVIQYRPPDMEKEKEYPIDPYIIFFKRRALYLDAYCPEEKEFRTFRVNRIRKLTRTNMIVPRRVDYSFRERHKDSFSVFTGGKPQKVRIRFAKRVRPYIEESLWHPSQKIQLVRGGDIILEMTVSEPKEVGWWVMQWGSGAEVLEPKELREWVREEIEKMTEVYNG